jgi:hypothetical protein
LWASSGASVPSILARICSPMLGRNCDGRGAHRQRMDNIDLRYISP